jgi:uncharacterized protein with NRDE domain
MCSVIVLRRPGHAWPLLLAGNRDELRSRPWQPPGRHWPDRPEVVAGRDVLADGSWLGVNDHGVVAVVLNRIGTLGPAAGKRSRGELVLDALDVEEAASAAETLADLDPDAYRAFNLIVADARDAFWLRHANALPAFGFRAEDGTWQNVDPLRVPSAGVAARPAAGGIVVSELPAGLSMITANDLNDPASPRIAKFRPQFQNAPVPDPEGGDWSGWIRLLAERASADDDPRNAMNIVTDGDYGTVCTSLVALPGEGSPRLWFAAGRPDEAPFEVVEIDPLRPGDPS